MHCLPCRIINGLAFSFNCVEIHLQQGTLNEKTSCFSLVSFNLPTTNRLLSIVKCESMSSELKCNYMCVKIDLPVSKSFLDDLSNCQIVKMLSFL